MTGLNLESFLHLLRADFGAWMTLGLIAGLVALMAWTSWGSRRALRKCLVLSVAAHVGLALYGGTVPVVLLALQREDPAASHSRERIRQIKVAPQIENADGSKNPASKGSSSARLAPWDRTVQGLALADAKLDAARTTAPASVVVVPGGRTTLANSTAQPDTNPPAPESPEARKKEDSASEPEKSARAPEPTPPAGDEVPAAVVANAADRSGDPSIPDRRIKPERSSTGTTIRQNRPPMAAPSLPSPPLLQPLIGDPDEKAPPATDTVASVPALSPEANDAEVASPEVMRARPDASGLIGSDTNLRSRPEGRRSGAVVAAPRLSRDLVLPARPDTAPKTVDGPKGLAERPSGTVAGGMAVEGSGSGLGALPDGEAPAMAVVQPRIAPLPEAVAAVSDIRQRSRPVSSDKIQTGATRRMTPATGAALALNRVTPGGVPALPEIQGATGGRPLSDVPEVYRSRLDPNRSAIAYRAGASPASEQAVERALDWLARHQDTDGRWDAATARYDDGTTVKGDDDYTVHCPPGEPCFGECIYWEADTALTGLSLLAYLGAGYTQMDGKYAETVGRGLDFLLLSQKPDGDLRGKSRAVGMYCHAMAAIALCEAYALTGDERLRDPVERAIGFLAKSRARDGLAWRYAPGAPVGDTSILGWVVMALKSAKEVGIEVPSMLQTGTVGWLSKVSSGAKGGLARYQPQDNVTPTMTAEAWVCRQFLGLGGPGPASSEAADFLLAHGPRTDQYNLYYWYYGTLAMYQHGGDAWFRWNGVVRDEVVRRQRARGHAAGSWDPDDSPYGAKGGRIYCTALATLSLEVYYRYLRLYDDPKIPPSLAPRPTPGRTLGRVAPAANTPR